jgi:hypothetical protein
MLEETNDEVRIIFLKQECTRLEELVKFGPDPNGREEASILLGKKRQEIEDLCGPATHL